MSSSISRFFRSTFSPAAKPLGGRAVSQPRPVAAGISRVSATDFSKAIPMVNPGAGQPAGWAPVADELRRTLYRDVIPAPVVRQSQPALPGNVMLVHVRHTGRHLSQKQQAEMASRHNLVAVGSQVSVTDRRGGRHTYTWAMPTSAYLSSLRELQQQAPPPYTPRAAPAPRGGMHGVGGLMGPADHRSPLLPFLPVSAYLR